MDLFQNSGTPLHGDGQVAAKNQVKISYSILPFDNNSSMVAYSLDIRSVLSRKKLEVVVFLIFG